MRRPQGITSATALLIDPPGRGVLHGDWLGPVQDKGWPLPRAWGWAVLCKAGLVRCGPRVSTGVPCLLCDLLLFVKVNSGRVHVCRQRGGGGGGAAIGCQSPLVWMMARFQLLKAVSW